MRQAGELGCVTVMSAAAGALAANQGGARRVPVVLAALGRRRSGDGSTAWASTSTSRAVVLGTPVASAPGASESGGAAAHLRHTE